MTPKLGTCDGVSAGAQPCTNDVSVNSTPSVLQQASSAFSEMEAAFKKMCRYADAYSDMEKTLDQQNSMAIELAKKDSRISFLEQYQQQAIVDHEKRATELKNEIARLRDQLVRTKAELTAQHGCAMEKRKAEEARDRLRNELEAEKQKTAGLNEDLGRIKTKLSRAQQGLEHCKSGLKEWENKLSLLWDIDVQAFTAEIKELSTQYVQLMRDHFHEDLPENILADPNHWESLETSLPISFPPTNSALAKNMRMIAGLAVISPLICDNILTPCYYPESAVASKTMKDILEQQIGIDARRENMMRGLMLSAYTENEMEAASERAVTASLDEALSRLGPISTNCDAFRLNLSKLLQRFVDVWRPALFSKKLILATTEDDDLSEWEMLDEFGSESAQGEMLPGKLKFRMLNLFPRIYIPELDHIVHKGIILSPWQDAVLAAEQEHWDWMAHEAKRGRGAHANKLKRRDRRSSVARASP
ncbi:hypothetical protein GP486_001923 [Trichoglossum hirsutum]|uniref:Uncharacterized protein n=1 Tax=Trichoglossum hirsutum TaxID=265104 RepID=A0A9P8LFR4_9PEZI|nr:hypothetical protein GP486_001923 [Trichoglossum hirsutum]